MDEPPLASLVAILAFITHIVRKIRVDTMMLMVHDETSDIIDVFYPPYGDESPPAPNLDGTRGRIIEAGESGFVRRTDVERLVERARVHDAFVRMDVRAGDHLVRGTPMATAWVAGDASSSGSASSTLDDEVRGAVSIGYERTMDQDAGFGFRQLEDIAVKAMSPSVNDPVTAAHAVGHMADLLVLLTGCRLGPTVHLDGDGVPRAIVPDRDFRYYLDLCCGQLRRFGAQEPSVLTALLRMLRDVAGACRDENQRNEIRRAAALIATEAESIRQLDMEHVEELTARVEHALAGRAVEAYADRVGETRSM